MAALAIARYRLPVRGVLHVGAHECGESKAYAEVGVAKRDILWVEAVQQVVRQSRERDKELRIVCAVVSDVDDAEVDFRVASDTRYSSLYEFAAHPHAGSGAVLERVARARTKTLDTLVAAEHSTDNGTDDEANDNERAYNFLRLDVEGAEIDVLRGAVRRVLPRVEFVCAHVNWGGVYKRGADIPALDLCLSDLGFVRLDISGSPQERHGTALYVRRETVATLHPGRVVRRPPYKRPTLTTTGAGAGAGDRRRRRCERKTAAEPAHAVKTSTRGSKPARGVSTFVIVRSQDRLLRAAAVFAAAAISDVAFVFVGDQQHDAVLARCDTIVACRAQDVVESRHDLAHFAAWQLLAVHDLVDTSHALLVEDDEVRTDTVARLTTALAVQVASTPTDERWVVPDVIALVPARFGLISDLPLFPMVLRQLGMTDVIEELAGVHWAPANGRCISREQLGAFVAWYEPLIATIRRCDPVHVARYHARMLHLFATKNRLRVASLTLPPSVPSTSSSWGEEKKKRERGDEEKEEEGRVELRLSRAATETGAVRRPVPPPEFDWRFYAGEAARATGCRITVEDAARAHWALRGAWAGIACSATTPYQSHCRMLHMYADAGRTLVATSAGTDAGDAVADALACGFGRVVALESDFAHYAHCAARFAGDERVQVLHEASESALAATLAKLAGPTVVWLDTRRSDVLAAELRQIASHSPKPHTIVVSAAYLKGGENAWTRVNVCRMLAGVSSDYRFAFAEEPSESPLVATLVTSGSGSGSGSTQRRRTVATAPMTIPFQHLHILAARYGPAGGPYLDVRHTLQDAIASCEWRAVSPTDIAPGKLGPDPSPGIPKQLEVVYRDLEGVYREQTLVERNTHWSNHAGPVQAARAVDTLVIVLESARYGNVDVRAALAGALRTAASSARGPVDLSATRPSVLFRDVPELGVGTGTTGRTRLDVAMMWFLDYGATFRQQLSIDACADTWVGNEMISALLFPQYGAIAGPQTQIIVYEPSPPSPPAPAYPVAFDVSRSEATTTTTTTTTTATPPLSGTRQRRAQQHRRLFVVYHLALIGEWQSVATPQIVALCASGLVRECEAVLVSVVGTGAREWSAAPEFGSDREWQRKVRIVHCSESAADYERPAIRAIQTLVPDAPGVCCLYMHSKGVTQNASANRDRTRNIKWWREFMEYYLVENYRVCVDVLLGHGYDTCGVQWDQPVWCYGDSAGEHCLVTPHYSGNFWWATGTYLAKLRGTRPSRAYIGPEMWIGLQNPRAWSLHNNPYNPTRRNLYEIPYARQLYVGGFHLPRGMSAPVPSVARAESKATPDRDDDDNNNTNLVCALAAAAVVEVVTAVYGDGSASVDVSERLQRVIRATLASSGAFDFAHPHCTPPLLFGDPFPGHAKRLTAELRVLLLPDGADGGAPVTQHIQLHEYGGGWQTPFATGTVVPAPDLVVRSRSDSATSSAALTASSSDDGASVHEEKEEGPVISARGLGTLAPKGVRPIRWRDGVVRAIAMPMRGDYRRAKWPRVMRAWQSDSDGSADDDDDDDGDHAGTRPDMRIILATYGSAQKRVDVSSQLRDATVPGLALALTETINMPDAILRIPDPVPGVAKHLEVELEHGVCATEHANVAHVYGQTAVVAALKKGAELETGERDRIPWRVRRTVRVEEQGGLWYTPVTVVPYATLSLIVQSGMLNQIYGMAAACVIARHTHRALVFPFRVVARPDATVCVSAYNMPPVEADVAFEHLFDDRAFLAHLPCLVYRTGAGTDTEHERPADPPPALSWSSSSRSAPTPTAGDQKREKDTVRSASASARQQRRRRRLRRALVHGDTKLDLRPDVVAVRSGELGSAYALSAQHVVALNPFFGVLPDTQEDYNHLVDVVLSVRPTASLQRVADRLVGALRQHALRTTGSPRFAAAHCRQEADWEKKLSLDPSAFGDFVVRHLEKGGMLPGRPGRGSNSSSRTGRGSNSSSGDAPKPLAVYLLGGTQNSVYWRHLVALPDSRTGVVAWMRKESWSAEIPELARLGFEQAAVVDREVGLQADYFVGFQRDSTLSSLLVVEREAMGRASAPVMLNYPAHWLLGPGGASLYAYTGRHPRSHSASARD